MKLYSILVGGLLLVLSGCTSVVVPTIKHTAVPYIFSQISYDSEYSTGFRELLNQGIQIKTDAEFSGENDPRLLEYQQGTGCLKFADGGGVDGDAWCYSQSGYLHRYDISERNISVSGSWQARGSNDVIFQSNPDLPLMISGNRLYDKILFDGTGGYHGESYIEYMLNSKNQTPEEIITIANSGLMGDMLYKKINSSDLGDYVSGADILYRQINPDTYKEIVYYFSHKHPEYYYISYWDYCAGTSSGRCDIFGRGTRLFVDN